jgi:hypothetical protein
MRILLLTLFLLGIHPLSAWAGDKTPKLPKGIVIEEQPKGGKATKIVFIAGSNFFKPGEHEYIGGCAVLMDLVKQTPGVAPVLALDWPKDPKTFENAKAIVFFQDGGDKHAMLKGDRMAQLQKLTDAGVGLVMLHQGVDIAKDNGDRMRSWMGAAWEKGHSQRAHWVERFDNFDNHPATHGVKPFKIDDGWLSKVRFVPEAKGVTPLLRTAAPKTPAGQEASADAIVSWVYERPGGGRAFTFTGGHLHGSFAEEGYRRLLVNGTLWAAGVELPATGAAVALDPADLKKYLDNRPTPEGK